MKNALAVALAIAMLATLGASSANAKRRHEHDNDFARSALQRGEVLPIRSLLTIAARYLPGDVVEVKLETRQSGDLRYKIRVLTPLGRIRELVLDARTGEYVGIED
jgi:uncharacterized membrane protein YkoI